jgi:zinc protease
MSRRTRPPGAARAALASLAALAALALAASAGAQPRGAARPASGHSAAEIVTRTLPNGLKIIVWPDHDIPSVALYTWYRVGSRNEHEGITGISHFFEHMMFNGSRHYPPGEFDRVMEANGGSNNAYTSEDVTVYYDLFPRTALDTIFQLEADRICCLAFDSLKVESERGVVYSERRTTVDNENSSLLSEQVQAAAFVAHPYHHPVIGWPSDIEGWTLPDLKDYFRVHYAPNNATMFVVGDVIPADVFALAERTIGPIPSQPPPESVRTKEPPQIAERRVTIRKEGQVPLLQLAYHCGTANDDDIETLGLLMSILVDGESSRLYRRLVDTERVAVDVGGYADVGFDPGLAMFFATVSPGKGPAAAEFALVDELARLAREGPTAAELAKARNIKLAGYWRALKTLDGKAEALGHYEVYRGDYRKLFTAPQRYDRVTRAQVQVLARRIFTERNRTVGVLIPEEPKTAEAAPPGKGGAR